MSLSLSDFAKLCRDEQVPGFLNLRKLLPSDLEAAKALRVECEFVRTDEFVALNAPRDEEFALKVRTYLIANKLDWTFENLLTATTHALGQSA